MNMRKPGTVAQSKFGQQKFLNPRKQRAFDLMRYTLCEYRGRQRGAVRRTVLVLALGRMGCPPIYTAGTGNT